jgi:hypothetical protein
MASIIEPAQKPTRRARLMRVLRAAAVLGVSLAFLSEIFGPSTPAFWQAGLGDWIDPYFINYLLEHWYHAVTTFSDPFSPPMFYPAQKTLGYSHGLLLYAPFYLPIRLFVHPFQAYSLALFVIIETGILCLYVILRRYLNLSFFESLLLTVYLFTSRNVINPTIGVWSQRASVFLMPAILLLALMSYRGLRTRAGLVLAGFAGFLAALLMPHDFYSGFFACVFAAVFIVAWAMVEGRLPRPRVPSALRLRTTTERIAFRAALAVGLWSMYLFASGGFRTQIFGLRISSQDWRRPAILTALCLGAFVWFRGLSQIREDLRPVLDSCRTRLGSWLVALAAGGLLGFLLFLWVYLPAFREHSKFPEQDLLGQIRVRTWPRWDHPMQALESLSAYDTLRSFKLVAIGALLALVPWLRIDRKVRIYLWWALLISLIVLLMPLQIDGFSVWLAYFRHVPGFNVIRDPTRIVYVYELAFVLAAALLLTGLRGRPFYRVGICLLCLYFVATDSRPDRLGYERPVSVFRRWVEAPIAVDPGCRSFYVKEASPAYTSRSDNMWSLYAGDAMFIALRVGLPTLNGYSAWGPKGWELRNPPEPTYPERVRTWVTRNHLKGVCELDIEARTMRLTAWN